MGSIRCSKCSAAHAQIVSDVGRLCSDCLKQSIGSRLNKLLKSHRGLDHGDIALVAVSGGACSMALAKLLADMSIDTSCHPERGKVVCTLHVAYIDESTASRKSDEYLSQHSNRIQASLRWLGQFYNSVSVYNLEGLISSNSNHAQNLLNSTKDATSREDLIKSLRLKALLFEAQRLNCNKLIVGDSSTALASRFVSMTAKGMGYASPAETNVIDTRNRGCCVARPLLNVSRKELAFFCYFQGIPFVAPSTHGTARNSILSTTDDFIAQLSAVKGNTVSNITKMASRLRPFSFNRGDRLPTPPLRHMVRGNLKVLGDGNSEANQHNTHTSEDNLRIKLCKVCKAPLSYLDNETNKGVCHSCSKWILEDDVEEFWEA